VISFFRSLRTEIVDQYPDLAPLRAATRAGDWAAVSAFFQRLPARADLSTAVGVVAEVARSERFLQRVVDTERDSALARDLLGARYVILAWEARSAAMARYVSQVQARLFLERLGHAERLFAEATAIDPTDAAAWTGRITTARGLGLGVEESRRRYERAAEHCDVPYAAQTRMVQNLCPKWGGSMAEVFAFARGCLADSPAGTLGGALLANTHMEQAFTFKTRRQVREYFMEYHVRDEVSAAAAHTVRHPDFVPVHGEVAAHSAFAFVFHQGANYDRAKPHFAALGLRAAKYGWDIVATDWEDEFRTARKLAR
jgi:hypothetical protein